jgi:NADH:ubiquinone oxidoreductase subunit F (NADH-binding)
MTGSHPEVVLPDPRVESLEAWIAAGGGEGLARAERLGPEETIAELERAGLRGRERRQSFSSSPS